MRKIQKKSKRGLSEMIAYVLLIAGAVAMSTIVYVWIKNYIPKDIPKCDDGVSIMISDLSCGNSVLTFNLKNNGLFNVDGYYIKASRGSADSIATINLAIEGKHTGKGKVYPATKDEAPSILLLNQDVLPPESEILQTFTLTSGIEGMEHGTISAIEVTPLTSYKSETNQYQRAVCGNAKVKEVIPNGCAVNTP